MMILMSAAPLFAVFSFQALPLAIQLLLFVGACAGHVALLVFLLNWCYGMPVRRKIQKASKKLAAVLALVGPVLMWSVFSLELSPALPWESAAGWQAAVSAYVWLCLLVGLGIAPAITLGRLLRRRPAALLSNHTHTLDVAAHLGYAPAGRGKYRRLALLPGNEVFRVDFAERTFRLPRLPAAWDGLSILHLSDLHLCGTPDREFFQTVMDQCLDWDPDFVAVTGDIIDSDRHLHWIVPVLQRLRWRVAAFGVLGNHDSWHHPRMVRRRLVRAGFRVLANTWERLEVRGEPLTVIGHEGPWFRPAPDLSACPADGFRLCLSHTPDNIRWARRQHIDLMLSGHNHGGQIRFPVIGSVFVPSIYGRRYDCGTFHEPPTLLHVSRGLSGQQPLRYNCRPEVTRIVLRPSKDAG